MEKSKSNKRQAKEYKTQHKRPKTDKQEQLNYHSDGLWS